MSEVKENRFKRAKTNNDFVQNVNSDVKGTDQVKITTRNKTEIILEPNELELKQRTRQKLGRNLTIPLFVEELNVIEEAIQLAVDGQDLSINSFVRSTLLTQCKQILGEDEYNKIMSKKLNVIKNK